MDHPGLPVAGYQPQSAERVKAVNANKASEERLLRQLEELVKSKTADPRWCSIARTHFEQGFMALNRAIFQPGRVTLPEDGATTPL
jgi:hypothetical protein